MKKYSRNKLLCSLLFVLFCGSSTLLAQPQNNFNTAQENVGNAVQGIYQFLQGYNTPVVLKGEYSGVGLKIQMEQLTYTRDNANYPNNSSVAMDLLATFTLPFSISDGNNQITFSGTDIVLKGNGSTKLSIKPKDNLDVERFKIMEDKLFLCLDKDSYVEVDCNGFKSMRWKGYFEFSSDVMTPANPNDGSNVQAEFDVIIDDLSDILISTQIKTPFKINPTEDVIYEVAGVTADFSTRRNATEFSFPKGYELAMPDYPEVWTGFAVKTISVELTEQFPDFPIGTASGKNLLIDETGFSGWFEVTGNKDASFWGDILSVSLNSLSVGLCSNAIIGGGLDGSITIHPLKDNKGKETEVSLKGEISSNRSGGMDFLFKAAMAADQTYDLPMGGASATLSIFSNTSVEYKNQTIYGTDGNVSEKLRGFYFNLNGSMNFDNKPVKMEGLNFENVQLSTTKPYFGGGNFSLKAVELNLAALNFTLNNIAFSMQPNTNELDEVISNSIKLGTDIKLELIGKSESNAGDDNVKADDKKSREGTSITAGFTLSLSKKKEDNAKWEKDQFKLDSIKFNLDYSVFRLGGAIGFFKDDQMYGDGFHGAISLGIDPIKLSVDAEARFGKTTYSQGTQPASSYKYWMASADARFPGVPMFPPCVMLNSASILVYSKMQYVYDKEKFKITSFYPDVDTKFGFKAGIGVYVAKSGLLNADAAFGMKFNSHGGLDLISLEGNLYFLADDPAESLIKGQIYSEYNFIEDIFDLNARVTFKKAGISGDAGVILHTEPERWYFNIGNREDPCGIKFGGFAKVSSYFMLGEVPAYLPPLDQEITAKFGIMQSEVTEQDHTSELANGQGFAFGAEVNINCGPNKFIYADVILKGGTDALVVRRDGWNCGGSSYRGSGRTYLYMDLGAGIKFRKDKYEFLGLSALAVLNAEFPRPYVVSGVIGFEYRLLGGMISGHGDAHFSAGDGCKWVKDN